MKQKPRPRDTAKRLAALEAEVAALRKEMKALEDSRQPGGSATVDRRETRATKWLRDRFSERQEWPSTEIAKAYQKAGYGRGAIEAAKKKLGIISDKKGFQGPMVWHLQQ